MTSKSRRPNARAPRVLVICKKSTYQIQVRERKSARIGRLLGVADPATTRIVRAHEDHVSTIAEAKRTLARLGAKAVFRYRGDASKVNDFDLLVALGGDGTLLRASHIVGPDCPVVAINTAPSDSFGHFCAGTKHDLDEVLAQALAGMLRQTRLSRMRVDLDGELVSSRVLNDALFCHQCPAATSRYIIRLGSRREEHKSSGVWVGPAAGSTAAQLSAGGRTFSVTSKRLQFVVRELSDTNGKPLRMRHGFIKPQQRLVIQSRIRAGRLYLDGPHLARAVDYGSELCLRLSDEPLTLLGFVPG